jgi:hypothetical protein
LILASILHLSCSLLITSSIQMLYSYFLVPLYRFTYFLSLNHLNSSRSEQILLFSLFPKAEYGLEITAC